VLRTKKLTRAIWAFSLLATVGLPFAALAQQSSAPPPVPVEASQVQPGGVVPLAAPKPFEDVIKLWRAGLSEDFIRRKIEREGVVYNLTADDIVKCKAANTPESLIETMLKTQSAGATSPSAVPGVSAVPVAAPMAKGGAAPVGAAVAGTAMLAAQADRTWEGIVRRNPGIVVFKSRWDTGKLSFKEEKFLWLDSDEESKNLVVPGQAMKEQFLNCLKSSSDNPECFEWGFKTEKEEYRFRDIGWERSDSKKPQELFDFVRAVYPGVISSKIPVEKK
jgi:hypothetical protein